MDAQLLCDDIFFEAMQWMDAETLSISACVNSSFRAASSDDKLWEGLCSRRWPSTTDPDFSRKLISDHGGYKKFYSECARLIDPEADPGPIQPIHHSRFASLVDVHFRGKPLFSQFMSGIPGAGEFSDWFSSCPFRLDAIVQEWRDEPRVSQKSNSDRNRDSWKMWRDLWDGMKVSWILIDRENHRVANLSSWGPLTGQRNWPCDDHFVLNFGSVVSQTVECSIILKCRVLGSGERGVELTELSLQVKKVDGGEHLSGRDALPVLCSAMAVGKTRDEDRVMRSIRRLVREQSESKSEEQRHEWVTNFNFVVFVVTMVLMVLAKLVLVWS